MLDKMTGRSRGFAFVEYGTAEEAQKAIEQLKPDLIVTNATVYTLDNAMPKAEAFAVRDGIPVMLPEEARLLKPDDPLLNR